MGDWANGRLGDWTDGVPTSMPVGRKTRRAVDLLSRNRVSAPVLSRCDQGLSIALKSTTGKGLRFGVGVGITQHHRNRWVAAQNRRGKIIGKTSHGRAEFFALPRSIPARHRHCDRVQANIRVLFTLS